MNSDVYWYNKSKVLSEYEDEDPKRSSVPTQSY